MFSTVRKARANILYDVSDGEDDGDRLLCANNDVCVILSLLAHNRIRGDASRAVTLWYIHVPSVTVERLPGQKYLQLRMAAE